MSIPLRSSLCIALCGAVTALAAQADEHHREHGAHTHGLGTLNVVRDGAELEIELIAPAANLLGFEYAPRTEAEREALRRAVEQLHRDAELFELPAAAGCRSEGVAIHSALLEAHGAEEHGPDHDHRHEGEAHADFEIHYAFRCDTPAQLDRVTVRLFESFPATETLEVQLVGPTGQHRTRLTAHDNLLTF